MRRVRNWSGWSLRSVVLLAMIFAARQSFAEPVPSAAADRAGVPSLGAASKELQTATFGSGCFWCSDAIFRQMKGIEKVVSGYSGGHVYNPSYKQVMTGATGHYEVVQVTYDPEVVGYEQLLEVFFSMHDPTNPLGQGPDIGPQYRSVIFYHDSQQQQLANQFKTHLNARRIFGRDVVTNIRPFREFFPAEDYHQDYFASNRRQPYCRTEIAPKLAKFRKAYKHLLNDAPAVKK